VKYWECRRDVFGPEKYVLRLTLSEALRGDLAALKAGVFRLLPHKDLNGRRLLFLEASRHSKVCCTTESLMRAFWYLVEISVKQGSSNDCIGFTMLSWDKKTSVWDFDLNLHMRIFYFNRNAWPIKALPTHLCCPPQMLVRILKPGLNALMDTMARSRTILHDVPEDEIVSALSRYGILKYMIPTEMGGTMQHDIGEWIAQRYAAELEQIA